MAANYEPFQIFIDLADAISLMCDVLETTLLQSIKTIQKLQIFRVHILFRVKMIEYQSYLRDNKRKSMYM